MFSHLTGRPSAGPAHLDEGAATMRVNNARSPEEVDAGWVLTGQALPTSPTVFVDYDA